MILTGLSAFIISYIHPNLFLFIVGVFTIYLASTGFRMIALKNIYKGQKPSGIDYLLTILMFLASLSFFFLELKIWLLATILGLYFVYSDLLVCDCAR